MHKTILERDLLCQSQTQTRFLVTLPVPRGTRETSSADNKGVWPCDWNYNLIINSATHIRNGFFRFCCHQLTQIHGYTQGLLSENSFNIENKWRKNFPLLISMLNVIFILFFFPLIQERTHWLLLVGVAVFVPYFDINYGLSMAFP